LAPFTAFGSHSVTCGLELEERAMSNGEERLGQGVPNGAIYGEFWLGDEVFGACDHEMRCRDESRGLGIF
jgi:hypothetical protein